MIRHSICRKTTKKWCEKSNTVYCAYDDALPYPLNTIHILISVDKDFLENVYV